MGARMAQLIAGSFAVLVIASLGGCASISGPLQAKVEPSPLREAQLTENGRVAAQVVRVIDGDTIDVVIDGVQFRVRYIGVDTPETHHPSRGVEPFGFEATEANRALVEGKTVYLEKDISETDRYGRLLRYVWLADGRMVNEVLTAEGYAQVSTYPPDVKYQEAFLTAQREARDQGRGLWSAQGVGARVAVTPTPVLATVAAQGLPAISAATPGENARVTPSPTSVRTPRPTPTATPRSVATARSNCHSSYPDVCIPPPPPDLDCGDIRYRRFRVLPPDPHRFDAGGDGIGCER